MANCIACNDTGTNSKGDACASCIMNCKTSFAPKMKGNTVASASEEIVPNGSIIRNGNRFGIVKGYKHETYNIAVIVNGEYAGNENWFRRQFNVVG